MEPEAKYTLVGTVVLILLAAMAAAIVWLQSAGEGRNDRKYKIYFAHQSLEGLQDRSPVKLKGIEVGSVQRFVFSSKKPGAVEVTITVEPTAPVLQGAKAVVERHLVTGIASIRLLNVSDSNPRLTEAPSDEPYPVIAEGESQLDQFSESATQLAQHADEMMQRVTAMLSPQNQKAFTATLANLQQATSHAEQTLQTLQGTLASMGQAADQMRTLGASVGADTHKLAQRYDALGAESATALREVTTAVKQMGSDVSQLSQQATGVLTSSDVELRVTAQELRETAHALTGTARRLSDPGKALFGPSDKTLGPGEGAK